MQPYLYTFLGELSHSFLPQTHIRNQINSMEKNQTFLLARIYLKI